MFILFLDKKTYSMKQVAIFGSGNGSNIENICDYFKHSSSVRVVLVYTNNKNAFLVTRAKRLGLPVFFTNKTDLNGFDSVKKVLEKNLVDYIILAGFLLKIPQKMVSFYQKKIINLHPSLLPKYGGKGMYGENVHRAVLENNESLSGITIHFINENYDEGEVVLQRSCVVSSNETVLSLQKKIKSLEKKHFPKTIEKIITQ